MSEDSFEPSIRDNMEKYKVPLGLSLLGLVLISAGVFIKNPEDKNIPKESLITNTKIQVDVSGAVVNPGVYELDPGSRVEDAIKSAGGLVEEANIEYTSKYINMAQKLIDGSKIYLPFEGDSTSPNSYTGQGQELGIQTNSKVNLNSASQGELESLSGVGPVTAAKIISGRPYQTIEEILSKKIVSKGVFEKIKDALVLY